MGRKIYVVFGPNIEWSDGVGPLGYFATKEGAEEYLKELCQQEEEEGMWAWRSVFECGHIQEFDAEEIGFNPNEKTLEEFLEELNSLV